MDLTKTVPCEDWKDFVQRLMDKPYSESLLWRGQCNSEWEIIPSYTREVEKQIKDLGEEGDNSDPGWSKAMEKRFSQACELSDDYDTLLYSIPEENLCFKVGRHSPCRKPGQEFLPLSMYTAQYSAVLNSARTKEDKNFYARYGTPYDVTFGVDIDLELWTWGQHYGVATPLVDWTEHALFALFFACDTYDKVGRISIYSLNTTVLDSINGKNYPAFRPVDPQGDSATNFFKFYQCFFRGIPIWAFWSNKTDPDFENSFPLFDDMRKLKLIRADEQRLRNKRCLSQAGWFTFTPGGVSVEEWCRRWEAAFSGENVLCEGHLLTKYVFKFGEDDRRACLDFLERANITAKALYPDFYGISRYLQERRKRRASRGGLC